MPQGKPAGIPCIQLDGLLRCRVFGEPARPACCSGLQPSPDMCGPDRTRALQCLATLELLTRPDA
jgi:hypothetical protein